MLSWMNHPRPNRMASITLDGIEAAIDLRLPACPVFV